MRARDVARRVSLLLLLAAFLLAVTGGDAAAKKKKKAKEEDPYAAYVWPPPPDPPRIRLVDVIEGRLDVEADSKWRRVLLGSSPGSPYDQLQKPFAVGLDAQGRLLVTDSGTAALIRFDRNEGRMDVLGTQGSVRLSTPLGLEIGPDGTLYVADVGLKKVVAFEPDGKLKGVYGKKGELVNPTDAAVNPDGKRILVADSKGQRIVAFDLATGEIAYSFGAYGEGDGEFNFPTSLTFGPEGNLFVVDQLNARIQVFTEEGDYLDQFGKRGMGFGDLVRPKDIAVDAAGVIYVVDNAFNNIQIFDADFSLLTFVGEAGSQPGQFLGASGVAVRDGEFAAVDQLGHRVQLFRYLVAGGG